MTTSPNYILRNPIYSQAILTTTGSTALFTGIPSGARRVVISFWGVSTTATSRLGLTIGNATLETASYFSKATFISPSTGNNESTSDFLVVNSITTVDAISGQIILSKVDDGTNTWVMTFLAGAGVAGSGGANIFSGGHKSITGGELQRLQLSLSAGTFDAGKLLVEAFLL